MNTADRRRFHAKAIGDAVRRLREEKGLTQESLAIRLDVDRRQVARIEAGRVPPTISLIEDLSRAFQCAPDEFLVSLYAEEPDYEPDPEAAIRRLADAVGQIRDADLQAALARPGVLRAAAAISFLADDDIEWLTRAAIALSWHPIAMKQRDLPAILLHDVVLGSDEARPRNSSRKRGA